MKDLQKLAVTGLVLALGALICVPAAGAEGEEEVAGLIERGQASYVAHCASCHGQSGLGDGLVAGYLTVQPPNLTLLAPDGGEFPFDEVYQVVDGREVPGHGTREMPVWGPALRGMDEASSKAAVKEKVVELVYYLKSIQGTGAASASAAVAAE